MSQKKPGIVHTIYNGPSSDGLAQIVKELEVLGFEKGEESVNENFAETFQTIRGKIFAPQTVEQYGKIRADPMPTDYDYDKYSFVLVLIRSYVGHTGTKIVTKELSPRFCIDINYDLLFAPHNDEKLREIPKVFLFDCARKCPNADFDVQELKVTLAKKYTKKTFVGFTLPSETRPADDDDGLRFFEAFVRHLEEGTRDDDSLQDEFERMQAELEAEGIRVSKVDNLGGEAIDLKRVLKPAESQPKHYSERASPKNSNSLNQEELRAQWKHRHPASSKKSVKQILS